MDKFAVVTEEIKDKLAGKKEKCPDCGADLVTEANVPLCPEHGTRPFENEGKKEKLEDSCL